MNDNESQLPCDWSTQLRSIRSIILWPILRARNSWGDVPVVISARCPYVSAGMLSSCIAVCVSHGRKYEAQSVRIYGRTTAFCVQRYGTPVCTPSFVIRHLLFALRVRSVVPDAPEKPLLHPRDSQALAQFNEPYDGGSEIIAYTLEMEDAEAKERLPTRTVPAAATRPDSGDALEHLWPDLVNGRPYRVRVKAQNAKGEGPYSPWSDYASPGKQKDPSKHSLVCGSDPPRSVVVLSYHCLLRSTLRSRVLDCRLCHVMLPKSGLFGLARLTCLVTTSCLA